MTEFKLKGKFGQGEHTCFVVENNEEHKDFNHLVGREVRLNGTYIKIKAVQVASLPPFLKGELIGLVA